MDDYLKSEPGEEDRLNYNTILLIESLPDKPGKALFDDKIGRRFYQEEHYAHYTYVETKKELIQVLKTINERVISELFNPSCGVAQG